jgi:phage repressor protein C with HTH and peptisase S24 domain
MTRPQRINAQRLRDLLDTTGLSQAALGRKIGISQAAVGKIATGQVYGSTHLSSIARALGTTAEYLTDLTDDPSEGALPTPTPQMLAEQLDVVQVAQIDLKFGMGGGAMYDAPVEAETMSFSRNWIRQFTSAPPEQLFFARGAGDSMFPTIGDGDVVLIDGSQKAPTMSDQIWAVTQYGHGMIKRLRPTAEGYKILSDNPNVPADTAIDGSMTIVGRVIAVVRRV